MVTDLDCGQSDATARCTFETSHCSLRSHLLCIHTTFLCKIQRALKSIPLAPSGGAKLLRVGTGQVNSACVSCVYASPNKRPCQTSPQPVGLNPLDRSRDLYPHQRHPHPLKIEIMSLLLRPTSQWTQSQMKAPHTPQ